MTAPARITFDYNSLPPAVADEASRVADRIRLRLKNGYLATGHDLLDMKEKLGHGKFGAWLDAEFGMTSRTAERYMAAARFEIDNSDIVSQLLPAALHRITAPGLAPAVRDACLAIVKDGKVLEEKDIKDLAYDNRQRELTVKREAAAKKKQPSRAVLAQLEIEREAQHQRDLERCRRMEQASEDLITLLRSCLSDADRARAIILIKRANPNLIAGDLIKGLAPTKASQTGAA